MSKTQKLPSLITIDTGNVSPIDIDEFRDVRSDILKDLPKFDKERSLKEYKYVDEYMKQLLLAAYKEGVRRRIRNDSNPYSRTYKHKGQRNSTRGGKRRNKRRTIKSNNRRF
jgi:hypothetical protein